MMLNEEVKSRWTNSHSLYAPIGSYVTDTDIYWHFSHFISIGFIIWFWWRRQLMPHSLTPSRYTRKTILHTRHSLQCFLLVLFAFAPLHFLFLLCCVFCSLPFILSFPPWWHTYLLLQFDDDDDDDDDYILCYPHPLNLKWNLFPSLFSQCFLYTPQRRIFLSYLFS